MLKLEQIELIKYSEKNASKDFNSEKNIQKYPIFDGFACFEMS